jgi:hypothetical protein
MLGHPVDMSGCSTGLISESAMFFFYFHIDFAILEIILVLKKCSCTLDMFTGKSNFLKDPLKIHLLKALIFANH